MALPAWMITSAEKIRIDSGLQPHQLEAGADETRMDAIISAHIEPQARIVLQRARVASGALAFPTPTDILKTAFPLDVEFPVLIEYSAADSVNEIALDEVREAAYALSLPANVRLQFPYQIGNPDDQEAPAQSVIDAAIVAWNTDLAERIEEQKQACILATEELVIAKLWYSIAGDDYQATAKGHWLTAQAILGGLEKTLKEVRTRYRRRRVALLV